MILTHVWGLFTHPNKEWESIREEHCGIGLCYLRHVLILAALPPLCAFVGATQVGWQVGFGEPVKLTIQSGLLIAVAFYLAMVVGVYAMGRAIHWMGQTYGAQADLPASVILAAYTATPLFLAGVIAVYPLLWLNMLVGLVSLGYTVYLLYAGVPVVMRISKEQGFLFSSAVLTVGMVMLVGMLALTVLLWGSGFGPQYTS